MKFRRIWVLLAIVVIACLAASGQQKRKIIIDQDAAGPGGTDQQAILLLIQSPQTEVLGITVVTGDAWLKSEVAHTLRTLELIGRTDIPVVPGAEYPLVRTKEETELAVAQEQHTRPRLVEEVKSWKSFEKALRLQDRELFHAMVEKIWSFSEAVENSGEGYVTEAFLLSLLISQQKLIDRLLEKKKHYNRDA